MADRFFVVPDDGGNPKYTSRVDAHVGRINGQGSGEWVVRFYASESTLDGIASESDVTPLTGREFRDLMNGAGEGNRSRSLAGWRDRFMVRR